MNKIDRLAETQNSPLVKDQSVLFSASGLTRRELVAILGSLTAGAALTLAGCGGGGGLSAGAKGGIVKMTGTVAFPSGFSGSQNALSVGNLFGASTLTAKGTFSVQVPSEGPNLTYLLDAGGTCVLMGFVDPTTNRSTINARSTAVALIYIGLDAYSMPVSARSSVVNLIDSNAATAALANVVSTQVAANPHALENSDPNIVAALVTAVNAIKASFVAARGTGQVQPYNNGPTPLMTIQPTGRVGGTELQQGSAPASFVAKNYLRRYGKIYVYKTGTVDANNQTTTFPTVQLVGTPVTMLSVENLSLFNALGDVFTHSAPYIPVYSAEIPLTLDAGTNKTLYDIVVVGSSFDPVRPTFFGMPQYANEVAGWEATSSALTLKAWFADILFALLLDAIGVRTIVADDLAIDAAISGLTAIEDAAWLNVIQRAQQGLFGDAAKLGMETIVTNDLIANKCFGALLKVIGSAETAAAAAVKQATFKTYVGVILRVAVNVAIAAFGALGVGDMAAVVYDIAHSTPGDVWTAVLEKPTLTLDPTSKTISPGDRVTFSVKPPSGTQGTVYYDWTQNGSFSTLSASNGTVGNSLTKITATSVDLVTTPSDQTNITVNVVAYTLPNGVRNEIGKAQAIITISADNSTNSKIEVNQASDSTAALGIVVFQGDPTHNFVAISPTLGGGGNLTIAYQANVPPAWDGTSTVVAGNILPYGSLPGNPANLTSLVLDAFYNLGGGQVGFLAMQGDSVADVKAAMQAAAWVIYKQ